MLASWQTLFRSQFFGLPSGFAAMFEPVAFAVHFEDVDVMGWSVPQRAGQPFRSKHFGPFIEGPI